MTYNGYKSGKLKICQEKGVCVVVIYECYENFQIIWRPRDEL